MSAIILEIFQIPNQKILISKSKDFINFHNQIINIIGHTENLLIHKHSVFKTILNREFKLKIKYSEIK